MLLIIIATIAFAWVGVLVVLCGLCLSAAAGDRVLPGRRRRMRQRRFEPARRPLVS